MLYQGNAKLKSFYFYSCLLKSKKKAEMFVISDEKAVDNEKKVFPLFLVKKSGRIICLLKQTVSIAKLPK